MLTQELINRGGSKLEATRLFLEEGLEIPIPKSLWLYTGESLESVKSDFEALKKPVIIRSSHRYDWHGMIGVIPTFRNKYIFKNLEDAVSIIESFMRTPEMKQFSVDDCGDYTEEVHFLIQEQTSNIVGSMLRHPNDPDMIIINYFNLVERKWSRELESLGEPVYVPNISFARYSENIGLLDHDCCLDPDKITDREILELIEMYKNVENSGLLEDGWAYQMEFGLDPLMFFQVRPFKQIEMADFNFYELKIDCPHLKIGNTYGTTPKEGVVLPFAVVRSRRFEKSTNKRPVCDITRPYGLIIDWELKDNMPITVPMGMMKAFFTGQDLVALLHGSYRFMKKAEVSGFGYLGHKLGEEADWSMLPYVLKNFRGNAKLISDGKIGAIIPEEFL